MLPPAVARADARQSMAASRQILGVGCDGGDLEPNSNPKPGGRGQGLGHADWAGVTEHRQASVLRIMISISGAQLGPGLAVA